MSFLKKKPKYRPPSKNDLPEFFKVSTIYPIELTSNKANQEATDVLVFLLHGKIITKMYDKEYDFSFLKCYAVYFPFFTGTSLWLLHTVNIFLKISVFPV